MKATQLALLFAVLATAALCNNALLGTSGGFYVKTGTNPSDCFLQFVYSLASDKATLGQQYKSQTVQPPSALPDGCHAQNFVFSSFFSGDNLPASDKLVPVAPADPSTNPAWNAVFNANWLYTNNGTGCVLLPQTNRAGLDQYLCSVNYAGTPLYFAVWGTGNFTFDTSDASLGAWIMNRQNKRITGASTLVFSFDTTFPNISAHLYGSCGSTSSVINSLSTLVTVTTATDLTANLAGVWLGYTLIKKLTATASGDYRVVPSSSQAALFTPGSGSGCWSMGISYSDILPDMNYCNGGCKVSFVLQDSNSNVYVMETSGIQTIDNSVGSGGGNGGNGGGNGGNGGGNGGNGGNGGPVSSASSMVFNACLLLISFAYLAWF